MPNLNVGLGVAMFWSGNANAAFTDHLIAGVNSTPGEYCMWDCNYSGCPRVKTCDCNSYIVEDYAQNFRCDDAVEDYVAVCYLGESGGTHYFCDNGYSACDLCQCNQHGEWYYTSKTGVIVRYDTVANANWSTEYECRTETLEKYGCADGYYKSGGTTLSPTCSPCPTPDNIYTTSALTTKATARSEEGNMASAANTCFISMGTYYDSTGKFSMSPSCKYSN